MAGALKTKVQIDGTTIWDDSDSEAPTLLINWEYEKTGTNQISELVINLPKTAQDTVALTVGKTVSVWRGYSTSTDIKTFEGTIAESSPEGGIIKLICKDKLWNLVRRKVNKIYEIAGTQAGQISAIAEDLIETYGGLTASVVATGTISTQTVDEFRCDYANVFERLLVLAAAVRYQFWYDPITDTVKFEPEGYNDSGATLTVGTEIIGVPRWSTDTSRLVNDLRVDGAVVNTQTRLPIGSGNGIIDTTSGFDTDEIQLDKTPESVELIFENANPPTVVKVGGTKDSTSGHFYYVDKENKKVLPATGTTFTSGHRAIVNYTWLAPAPIHQVNQESIDAYGLSAERRTLTDIQSVADASVRTSEILSRFSVPFLVGDLLVKSASTIDVNLGDKVTIVDTINNPNINKQLVVTKQVIKYPGSNQELTVGDESIRLADWQINTENRIKLLEDQISLKNQDLLLEIRDLQVESSMELWFSKVKTRDVSQDTIWGASTWGGGEWDDSYTNDEIDSFVKQKDDLYEENFVNTDFKNTDNTTADWTNTGSIDFTSGEIAESTSVNYQGATSTGATLTATEVSGTFQYDLSRDGGITWEEVTSGAAHTFSAYTNHKYEFSVEAGRAVSTMNSSTLRMAQTIRIGATGPNSPFTLNEVKFMLYRVGSPGTITFELKALDSDGEPTGAALVTATLNGNTLPTDSATTTMTSIALTGYDIEPFARYALILYGLSVDASNYFVSVGTLISDLYPGGYLYNSIDSGSTWNTLGTNTRYFEMYGESRVFDDIRWKATENAGSTGEISQIKIENYS